MLTAAFLATTISTATPGKIAFVSREYYPYPDKRVSHNRLRICNWDGSGVRTLSAPGQEVWDVTWLSKTRLLYAVESKEVLERDSYYLYDLKTGRSRLVAGPDFYAPFFEDFGGPYLQKSDKTYRVTSAGKLVKATLSPPDYVDPYGKDNEFKTVTSRDPKQPGKFQYIGQERFSLVGPKGKVMPQRFFNRAYWFPESNQLFLLENFSRGIDRLFKVDWANTKVQFICEYGYDIDWSAHHAKYAYITPRDMFQYGPTKMLYCSELWVGDHVLGLRKPIRKGELEFFAVSLQP